MVIHNSFSRFGILSVVHLVPVARGHLLVVSGLSMSEVLASFRYGRVIEDRSEQLLA